MFLSLLFSLAIAHQKILLTPKNTVVINTDINNTSVAAAQMELAQLVIKRASSFSNYPIYLVLDSPGGSITDGEAFIQFAKHIPNLHTISVFSASMASAIVQALPGNRYVTLNGTLMFHRARGGVQGQFETGELESRLTYYKQIVRGMEQRNANRMKVSLANYKALVLNEWWAYGKDALTQRMADDTADIVCSAELVTTKKVQSINIMGMFTVTVEYSGCPLIGSFAPVSGTILTEKEKLAIEQYKAEKNQLLKK